MKFRVTIELVDFLSIIQRTSGRIPSYMSEPLSPCRRFFSRKTSTKRSRFPATAIASQIAAAVTPWPDAVTAVTLVQIQLHLLDEIIAAYTVLGN